MPWSMLSVCRLNASPQPPNDVCPHIRSGSRVSSPHTTLILLNLAGAGLLEPCLEALLRQTDPRFRVLLIDQGCRDRSTEAALARLGPAFGPRLQVVWAGQNLGFTGGCNLGFSLTQTPYVGLLNVDAVASPGWLQALYQHLEQHPLAAMAASHILLNDSPDRLDNTGHLLYRDGLNLPRGRGQASTTPFPADVLCPSGCAALYRTAAIQDVGGFAPEFFAYGEDLDLGLLLRERGHTCQYVPEAVVTHRFSQTLGPFAARKLYLIERNRLRVLVRHFPARTVLASPLWSGLRYLASFQLLRADPAQARGPTRPTEPPTDPPLLAYTLALAAAWADGLFHLPTLLAQRRQLETRTPGHTRVAREWLKRQPVSLQTLTAANLLQKS